LVEKQPKEFPMTISQPGLLPLGRASAGAVRPPLRTVDADDGCEGAGPDPIGVGDFIVDWQLVVFSGASP
jgi:hypothetical protein